MILAKIAPIAVSVLLALSGQADAHRHDPAAGCGGRVITAKEARVFSGKVWRLGRWERDRLPSKVRRAWKRKVRCAAGPGHRKAMRARWQQDRKRFNNHRKRKVRERELAPFDCGAYGRFALPCAIVRCESGYDYRARNAVSTAGGYGQAIDSTWYAYGGAANGDYHPAAAATKAEQDRVFGAIWDGGAGISHWKASEHCWGGEV